MLRRLRNWCINATLRPGFVFGGGTRPIYPSPNLAARGGFKNNLLCASKVMVLVGYMVTFAVEER